MGRLPQVLLEHNDNIWQNCHKHRYITGIVFVVSARILWARIEDLTPVLPVPVPISDTGICIVKMFISLHVNHHMWKFVFFICNHTGKEIDAFTPNWLGKENQLFSICVFRCDYSWHFPPACCEVQSLSWQNRKRGCCFFLRSEETFGLGLRWPPLTCSVSRQSHSPVSGRRQLCVCMPTQPANLPAAIIRISGELAANVQLIHAGSTGRTWPHKKSSGPGRVALRCDPSLSPLSYG